MAGLHQQHTSGHLDRQTGSERDMVIDGISDAHRGTWSRLTRLHTASVSLPTHTTRVADPNRRVEDASAA